MSEPTDVDPAGTDDEPTRAEPRTGEPASLGRRRFLETAGSVAVTTPAVAVLLSMGATPAQAQVACSAGGVADGTDGTFDDLTDDASLAPISDTCPSE